MKNVKNLSDGQKNFKLAKYSGKFGLCSLVKFIWKYYKLCDM